MGLQLHGDNCFWLIYCEWSYGRCKYNIQSMLILKLSALEGQASRIHAQLRRMNPCVKSCYARNPLLYLLSMFWGAVHCYLHVDIYLYFYRLYKTCAGPGQCNQGWTDFSTNSTYLLGIEHCVPIILSQPTDICIPENLYVRQTAWPSPSTPLLFEKSGTSYRLHLRRSKFTGASASFLGNYYLCNSPHLEVWRFRRWRWRYQSG